MTGTIAKRVHALADGRELIYFDDSEHPHGQIYAYPYVTPRTRQLLAQLDAYGPALFADVLKSERAGPRVLLAGEHWTAFVPFAARWPVEAHLLPNEHVADFSETRGADKLKYQAGSESGMGAWVGDIPPEAQAQRLRAAIALADELSPV